MIYFSFVNSIQYFLFIYIIPNKSSLSIWLSREPWNHSKTPHLFLFYFCRQSSLVRGEEELQSCWIEVLQKTLISFWVLMQSCMNWNLFDTSAFGQYPATETSISRQVTCLFSRRQTWSYSFLLPTCFFQERAQR